MEHIKKQEYAVTLILTLGLLVGVFIPLLGFGLLGVATFLLYKRTNIVTKEQKTMVIMAFVLLGIYFALSLIFNVKLTIENMQNSSESLVLIFI